ncbi:MAG: sigma-54-dependent Fis family transcriptional regulator [Deltaproteobacteria bacterium]|nr:MAG: sigma-54-dependent Fis family transcriptional regulator [Deltaproteobacteria bacterium]
MTPRPRVLIVDDKPNMLRLLAKVLRGHVEVRTANGGAAALEALEHPVDLVLCDLKMPEVDGIEVLRATRARQPQARFVLMTAYATVDTAVEALRLGATDYLTKPFDPDEARALILRLTGGRQATSEPVLPGLIGASPAMRSLGDLVRRIAPSDATALLLGETGTGKERVARALHQLSPRAEARFVAVNVAAIPEDLLESELFGHVKGAFTGAHRDRAGLFEEAEGGSLFLDEIGEMRPGLQARLTRALEERAVRRIGEARERSIDVRVIAATHQDLPAMVQSGAFREDLWYRLNVATLRLPPLRDRHGDVRLLAEHFLRAQRGCEARTFAPQTLELLEDHPWPGNVRQLRAAVERACLVASGPELLPEHLPVELRDEGRAEPWIAQTWSEAMEAARAEAGARYLRAILRRTSGDVTEAATHAGVERESLYRLLRKHGVDPSTYR